MDRTIMESLQSWKTLSRKEHPEEAGHHLYAVLQYAAELVRKNDRQELDEIRYRLEKTVVAEKPADAASYYLGVAQGMLDWLNASAHVLMEKDMLASLSELERQLLQCIADHPRITPSQLGKAVHIDNKQHVSNLLSKMRAKELVSYWQAGKNRWYKVTDLGLKVLSELQTDEQQAVAVSKQSLSLHNTSATRMEPITFQYNDKIMDVYEFRGKVAVDVQLYESGKVYGIEALEEKGSYFRKVYA